MSCPKSLLTIRSIVLSALFLLINSTIGAQAQLNSNSITLVVPYSAGGGTDVVARLVANHMSRTLGRTIVVENIGGAGGTLGTDRVARSTPDGSTILINHVALLAAPSLFANLRYNTETAFEPVGLVNSAPMVLVGRKSIPGQQPKDFISWIKAQGSNATFAHGGIGTNNHLCGVLIGKALGFSPTFVAYRGAAPAVTDLLAGNIDLLCDQVTSSVQYVAAEQLIGIAVTSPERIDQLKDVPTTAELGIPEVNYLMWHGLYVPKGTPQKTVHTLNAALSEALSDQEVLAQFKRIGTVVFPPAQRTPAAHAELFSKDLNRVTALIESLGIKPGAAK